MTEWLPFTRPCIFSHTAEESPHSVVGGLRPTTGSLTVVERLEHLRVFGVEVTCHGPVGACKGEDIVSILTKHDSAERNTIVLV